MGIPVTGDYRLAFPSNFISSADLKGQEVTVKIARVELDDLPIAGTSKKERKMIITMATKAGVELKKKMVANKTKAKVISSLYGSLVPAWIGKPITLYPSTDKLKGKPVDCIRVKDKTGKIGDVPEGMMGDPDMVPEHDFADAADAADQEEAAIRETEAEQAERALSGREPGSDDR